MCNAISKNKIRFQLNINVYQVLGHDNNGELVAAYISTIIDEILNRVVKDNEYEAFLKVYEARENDYSTIDVAKVPCCEWLYYKTVWGYWEMVVKEYQKMNVEYKMKNPHLYRIELPNDMIIAPSLWAISLEQQEPELDFEGIPEKTVFKELPDGLELVRVGNDFPGLPYSNVDELNLNGIWSKSNHRETFPFDKILKIGEGAFRGYNGILHINLPNCKAISNHVFSRCVGLKSVNMPKLEHIGLAAFNECHFLRTFSYPKNIIDIDESAFYGCMNLKGFRKVDGTLTTSLPDGVKVGDDAFAYTPLDHLSDNPVYDPSIRDVDDF